MYKRTDYDSVDERIHRFMARKSPARNLSRRLAGQLLPAPMHAETESGISFEQTRWHRTHLSHRRR